MSDSDEEEISYYGTPLEPYDEDAFPKKKPISVEEQVAKDAQGRRRFHGAFTGGFSAGFFNTVGSLEGWAPSEFRSSRSDKAKNKLQIPEDYMDDEDVGQFGIAPQTVRATDDYSSGKKRKKQVHSDGPIPGIPVLESLLQAGNETVGYFLMKNMNRRHHQQGNTGVKVYGCVMPTELPEDDAPTDELHLHECYNIYLKVPKSNSFGLGYTSLDKTHLNLFQPAKLMIRERNNKKLSISGQAFGVGAFEDDDEDIYVKDDMTRYDFELTSETTSTKTTKKEKLLFDMFVISSKSAFNNKITFPPPVIPSSFTGKYKVKKSRFEPVAPEQSEPTLNAAIRAKYLGESTVDTVPKPPPVQEKAAEEPTLKTDLLNGLMFDRFVAASQSDDLTNILEPVKKFESEHGTEEMRAAAKMKMFGPLTRVTLPWQPCAFLCKRFNVPEPRFEELNAGKRKRTKNLIFEYQKHEEKIAVREPGLDIKPSTSLSNCKVETNEPTASANEVQIETVLDISETNTVEVKSIDITDRLDVSQKADLFKAVFLSSSESEESDVEEEMKTKELIAANIVSEPLLPKIKPIREGILSNLNFAKLQTCIEPDKLPPLVEDTNTYGPRLPSNLAKSVIAVINEPTVNPDEWVEKDQIVKEKKHKSKHKKKSKKHKHKSKR